ncbi:MAG TPA: hypothetical protein VJ506_09550 [Candidatus Limnocylindrales bacterium]|nr:hypothetical protein [Candidatus Limnocylindrales bacterium]
MTDATSKPAPLVLEGDSHGTWWHVELDRSTLIPGQLVDGRLRIRADDPVEARGLVVALTGVEHWRHRVTHTDAEGHPSTTVVTSTGDPVHEPVLLGGPISLASGETLERSFQLPVPPLGPASLDAEDAGFEWTLEAKLDVAGDLDRRLEAAVVVAQPMALLRAGAIQLGEFALYERADIAGDGITGTIELRPMPLVCGEPFSGRVELHVPGRLRLQEVRAEIRVHVEATVSEGEKQDVPAWIGALSPAAEVGGDLAYDVAGALPSTPLPSSELPHGRAGATFHVILAVAWAPDTHLVRDVAIASTSEV